jgi:ParB family transcriptional regulator, chromosome partitioning protein
MAPRTKKPSFFTDETTAAQNTRTTAVDELEVRVAQAQQSVPRDIRVDRIRPNPFQARKSFNDLDELIASIQTQGFISRLRVRPDPADGQFFQLAYGERRWRAAQQAGLLVIPCDVAAYSDAQMLEFGLIENIQRQDLNPLEEGSYFRNLIDGGNYSIRSLAERIGKDKGYVEGRLALLKAPVDVQELVIQRPDTIDAARQISRLRSPEQRATLLAALRESRMSSRAVREEVKAQSEVSVEQRIKRMVKRDKENLNQILVRWEALLQEDSTQEQIQQELNWLITRLEQLLGR